MADYVIRTGDCFASIAARYGVAIENLLSMGDNKKHREDGRTAHQLRPGDVIEVPDEEPDRTAPFSSGGSKSYKVTIPKVRFKTRLMGRSGRPHADKKYELVVDYRTYEGRSDGDGWIEQQIPAAAREGELRVWLKDGARERWTMRLAIGGLHPHAEDSGIAHRLANLGYGQALRGEEGLSRALAAFQSAEGLPSNGKLDDTTLERLESRRTG